MSRIGLIMYLFAAQTATKTTTGIAITTARYPTYKKTSKGCSPMRNYGYKVCYKHIGKHKTKIYIVTNSYAAAIWHVRWYEREPPLDRKTKLPILNVKWLVIPIKTFIEYRRLWRGCPF